MWEIIKAGGPVMWPIIALSITAAAILLERLWSLQDERVIPRELTDKVWKLVESGLLTDKHVAALAQNSALGQILAAGLANRQRSREHIKEAIEDTGRHVVHELERFLNMLGTIAAVSPLLGLLGTVIGIITAFNAITQQGVGDPKMLSGGIGQALIATAAGLIVAIPSLMGYRYLRGKVDGLVIAMEKEALKLVRSLDERRAAADPLVEHERLASPPSASAA
ncbi:MAG TPA: MotA/TolQ/ExbB proton channel family protein [Steroidobacteraceae bacterium]|nr:MotA/TolQ/ExbB proton channel family protein [Steroidobacteraceae bacterium]